MADGTSSKPTFSPLLRLGIVFNVAVSIAAALTLAVMVNYLSARHHWRFPLALNHLAELSPQTERILRSLTNEFKVTVFFDTRDTDENRGTLELYGLVTGLLREYNDANPKIVVRTVDPTRHPAEAELMLANYRLSSLTNRDFVILDCDGRSKLIYKNELADYRYEPIAPEHPNKVQLKLTAFRGEVLFTTALFNLANPRQFKICFTQGHGEHDPERLRGDHGYGKFAQALKEKTNAEWEKLQLVGTNDIPADCQLLIIAGPRQAFSDPELAKIENYLKQGGRLFVLFSSPALASRCGLERVLANWNVGVGEKIILDPKHSPTGQDLLTARMNTQNPIMAALVSDSENLRLLLVLPRAVGPIRASSTAPDAPRLEILAATSPGGIEVSDVRSGVPYPNPFQDRTNSFPLITAVEQGGLKNISAERGVTRIIAVGDSLCLDNQMIDSPSGNHYFATLAVNWLLDRPQILLENLVPQPLKSYRLSLTGQQMQTMQWLLLGALPGGVLLLGALVWWRRRH